MLKPILLLVFLMQILPSLYGQVSFPDLVTETFGSDQELVNGTLFSNQYFGIGGNPYFFDGKFRKGSVVVNNREYADVMLRYNLYSQRVEIDYWTSNGNEYQFISVPEHLSSFSLEGFKFCYMLFPNEDPMYYQVISEGDNCCYVGWKVETQFSNDHTGQFRFSNPDTRYVLKLDDQLIRFQNKKTFVKTFPEKHQKEASKLLKQKGFNFKHPSANKIQELMKDAFYLYETNSNL